MGTESSPQGCPDLDRYFVGAVHHSPMLSQNDRGLAALFSSGDFNQANVNTAICPLATRSAITSVWHVRLLEKAIKIEQLRAHFEH